MSTDWRSNEEHLLLAASDIKSLTSSWELQDMEENLGAQYLFFHVKDRQQQQRGDIDALQVACAFVSANTLIPLDETLRQLPVQAHRLRDNLWRLSVQVPASLRYIPFQCILSFSEFGFDYIVSPIVRLDKRSRLNVLPTQSNAQDGSLFQWYHLRQQFRMMEAQCRSQKVLPDEQHRLSIYLRHFMQALP
jgi:hypothetical protein